MSTNLTAPEIVVEDDQPTVRLAICYNPFIAHDIVKHVLLYAPGKTLADYMEGLPEEVAWGVAYQGEAVDPADWATTFPEQDSLITLVRLPEGGGNGGKTILRLVAMLAVVAFAVFVGGPMLGSALASATGMSAAAATTFATAAVTMTGAMAISLLIPAINPSAPPSSSSYSINGPTNTAKEGQPAPIIYGEYRVGGNITDIYTENVGDDQYLFMRTMINDGPVNGISTIQINGQDYWNFQDVEYIAALGQSTDPQVDWFKQAVDLYQVGEQITQSGVVYTTTGEVDRLRVDVNFPVGLISIVQKSGNIYSMQVQLAIQYQPLSADGTTTLGPYVSLPLTISTPLDTSGGSGIVTVTNAESANFTIIPAAPTSGTQWSVTAQYRNPVGPGPWITVGTRTGTYSVASYYGSGYTASGSLPSINWNVSFPGNSGSDWEVQFIGGSIQDNTLSNPNLNSSTQDNVPGTINNLTVNRKTQTPFNLTFESSTLTRGRYNIKITRSNDPNADQVHSPDQCWVTNVGEIQNNNVTYAGNAMMSLKIKLTNQLSSIPTVTSLVQGSLMTVYDDEGNATTNTYSNNPADIVLDMMLNPNRANMPTSMVSFPMFSEWRDYCTANSLVFNGVFDFVTTLWDAIQAVAKVGHAVVCPLGTQYQPVIDQAADPVMVFTPGNMYMDTFTKTWTSLSDRANEIQQVYFDSTDNFVQKTLRLPNVTLQSQQGVVKPVNTTGFGVTTITQATLEAEYLARQNSYTTHTVQFDAPIEACGLRLGDVAIVQTDSVNYAQGVGGRLAAGSTTSVIQLDRPITMTTGESYSILVNTDSLQTGSVSITAINGNKVTVSGLPASNLPQMNRIIQGSVDREIIKVVSLGGTSYSILTDDASSFVTGVASIWATDLIYESPVVFSAGTHTSVTLTTPMSGAPAQYAIFMFGQSTVSKLPYRLIKISGSDDLYRRTLTFSNYDANVYATGSWGIPTLAATLPVLVSQVQNLQATYTTLPQPDQTTLPVVISWQRPNDTTAYAGADVWMLNPDGITWTSVGSAVGTTVYQTSGQRGASYVYKVVTYSTNGQRALFDAAPTVNLILNTTDITLNDPSGLTASLTAFSTFGTALASWTASTTTGLDGYQVEYATINATDYATFVAAGSTVSSYPTSVTTDSNYSTLGTNLNTYVSIPNLLVADYAIRVRAVKGYTTSDWIYVPLQVAAPSIPLTVTNLVLSNSYPAGGTNFVAIDAAFAWDDIITMQAAATGNQATNLVNILQDYEVQVLDATTSAVIRTEYTSSPNYVYTFAKNYSDAAAAAIPARRSFKISVSIRGKQGQVSGASVISVTNSPPALTSITVIPGSGSTTLTYSTPTDPAFSGIIVWASTSSGFTPGSGNLVYQGPGNATFATTDGLTYYYVYAFYDQFSTTGLNVSTQASFVSGLPGITAYAAPSVPTGLSVATVIAYESDGTPYVNATASWTASTGTGLSGYKIGVTLNGGNEVIDLCGGTTYTFRMFPGESYSVRVAAYSSITSLSAYTTAVAGNAVTDSTVPSAPTSVSGTSSVGTVFLQWTNPTGNIRSVQIWTNTTNNSATATLLTTVNATASQAGAYTQSGMTPGSTVYYWLKAITSSAVASVFSTVASVTVASVTTTVLSTTAAAGVPTGLALATAATVDPVSGVPSVTLTATWTASTGSPVSYEVALTQGSVVVVNGTNSLSYTWTVLANTSYSVQVRAVDALGNRTAYCTSVGTTSSKVSTAPSAPTSPATTAGINTIWLSWTNPSNVDVVGVEIFTNTTNTTVGATLLTTVNATPSTAGGFAHTGLSTAQTVWYFLKAVNSSGVLSAYTTGVSGTTVAVAVGNLNTTAASTVPTGLALSTATTLDPKTSLPNTSLTATWTASTGSPVGYEVSLTQGAITTVTAVNGTTFTWTGLQANVSYSVQVRSIDALGNRSAYCTTVAQTTAYQSTAPALPTGAATTAGLNTIWLSWTNAATADISNVQIWTNTTNTTSGATPLTTVNAIPSQAGAFTHSGLSTAQTVWYFLKSVNTSGVASGYTTGVSGTTAAVAVANVSTSVAAAVPTGLSLSTAATVASGTGQPNISITATWTASTGSPVSYEVQLTVGGISTIMGANGTTYTWSGLLPNVSYSVQVRALDSFGNKTAFTTASSITSATQSTAPALPTGLAITAGLTTLWLSWTNAATADLAQVQIWTNTTNTTSGATLLTTVNATPSLAGAFAHSGLTTGQTVWYFLKSVNTSGVASAFTTGSSGTTASVSSSMLATGLQAVSVVSSLPSASGYTGPSVVFNTTDGNLYRYASGAWTAAVPTTNLTGTITGTQIASGTITTANILANTITASNIAANTITASQIAANTITAGQIAAGTITATQIAANTITASQIAAGTITSTQIAAGTITASNILAGTITGTQISTSTSLPGTITVGVTGVSIGTIQTQAAGPAAVINAGSTTINPGNILISGTTYLSNWISGTSTTLINGGSIASNSIVANSLQIGARGLTITGITFSTAANVLSWTAGTISYTNDSGTSTSASISAGSVTWTTGIQYVYWTEGAAALSTTTTFATANASTAVIFGTYSGGTTLVANYGATVIQGSQITTGSITATQIAASTITGTQIAATTITASNIAANTITAAQIAAGTITASQIAAGTITGTQISTSTSLPGTITVGVTGVSIGTIQTQAANPATVINAGSTTINPGLVLISGTTYLSSWISGTNTTEINGGSIAANSIVANTLQIGARGLTVSGLTFQAPTSTSLTWTAGTISYTNDAGTSTSVSITSGSVAWSSGVVYVYWVEGATTLSTTTTFATANAANAVVIATYAGGLFYVANYGGTIIDGSQITTGSITASQIAANTITASQIAAGTITGTQIAAGTITASNILAGTITGTQINTATSLPGTITIGVTGVSIGTVQTQAAGPAAVINAGSTTINPGNILISGASTLSSWISGTSTTLINGGSIAANSIVANALQIGARGLTLTGLTFSTATNTLSWIAGTIAYTNDSGTNTSVSVSAGSVTWTTGTQYVYWVEGATTLSTTTTFATANATNAVVLASYTGGTAVVANYGATIIQGSQITTGSITATQIASGTITGSLIAATTITASNIAANTITASQIAAGTITATQIASGTITGSLISTSTSLPGTITVGATGVTIATVQSQAAAPAATINAGTTLITPGLIQLTGTTALSSWLYGGDNTKINGGSIAANTITANSLQIGNRGITTTGIQFSATSANVISWTAGTVYYVNDSGTSTSAAISAGSYTWTTGSVYIYWTEGNTTLSTTATYATAAATGSVVMCAYAGGLFFEANYGTTVINGAAITTGSITAAQLNVASLSSISANIGTVTAGLLQSSTGSTQLDLTNARIVFNNGTYMKVIGINFGASSNLIEWYGPTMAVSACTTGNAISYLTSTGSAYFGGVAGSVTGQGLLATSSLTPAQVTNIDITIVSGAISGIGTGTGTIVDNTQISISSGAISGIGTGNGTAVANSLIPTGTGNRVILSQAEKGTIGWQLDSYSASSPGIAQQTYSGLTGIQCGFTATASGQYANTIGATAYRFAVTAYESLACSALFNTTPLATASFNIEYYNSSGSFLSDASIGASVPVASTLALREAILTVPAGAVSAAVWFSTTATGAGVAGAAMYQPMVQGVPAGQTTYPAFTPGPNSAPGSDPTLSVVHGGTGNRVVLSQFEKGTTGWAFANAGFTSPTISTTSTNPNGISISATATAANQYGNAYETNLFAVTAGEQLALSAIVSTGANTNARYTLSYRNSSGGFVGSDVTVGGTTVGASVTSQLVQGMTVVPATAVNAIVYLQAISVTSGSVLATMYQPSCQGVTTGATLYPAFMPGPNSSPGSDPNSLISVNSNGTLNGAGGGQVTIGGLGYLGSLKASQGSNVVWKPTFSDGSVGQWGSTTAGANVTTQVTYGPDGSGEIDCYWRDTYEQGNYFLVTPGHTYYVDAWCWNANTGGYAATIGLQFTNATGGSPQWVGATGLLNGNGWTHLTGTITVPTGAVQAIPWLNNGGAGSTTLPFIAWSKIYIGQVQPGATMNQSDSVTNSAIASAATTANFSGLSGTPGSNIANSAITVSGGTISGIGTGSGTVVDNSYVSLSGLGAGSLATLSIINTTNINSNAVTNAACNTTSTYSTTTINAYDTFQTTTLTTAGGYVSFWAMCTAYCYAGLLGYWRVVRDGSTVVAIGTYQISNQATTPLPVIMQGVDSPGSGSHTYTFQCNVASNNVTANNITLLVQELRR